MAVIELKQIKVACHNCRLSELCLPRGLDENEIDRLDGIVDRGHSLEKATYLYRQGDRMSGLFAVRSGSLRSFVVSADGLEQTVGFYLPGELMGLDGMEHNLHTCSTVALESSAICEVPFSKLNELCAQLPGLQRQMLRLIGKEVSADHQNLLLIGSRSAEERVATFLLSLSTRFGQRGYSPSEFRLTMSRHEIANFLGITSETVSRQLSMFQRQGILTINQRRHVTLHDLQRLRSRVESCLGHDAASTN